MNAFFVAALIGPAIAGALVEFVLVVGESVLGGLFEGKVVEK